MRSVYSYISDFNGITLRMMMQVMLNSNIPLYIN